MYNLKKQQPLVLKLDDNIKQQMIWQACYKSDNFVMEKLWHVKENIELSPFNEMPLPFEKYSYMYDMYTCIMNQNQQICQFSST